MIPFWRLYSMPCVCLSLCEFCPECGLCFMVVLQQPWEFHLNICRSGFSQWFEGPPLQISWDLPLSASLLPGILPYTCSFLSLPELFSSSQWDDWVLLAFVLYPGNYLQVVAHLIGFPGLRITALCCLSSNVWKIVVSSILPTFIIVYGRTAVP